MRAFLGTLTHALRGHRLRIQLCTGPTGDGWSDVCSCGARWDHGGQS